MSTPPDEQGDTVGARTIAEYVAAIATPTATPGGGSVSAVSAAMAAALLQMVTGITLEKLDAETDSAQLLAIITQVSRQQQNLMQLAGEDEAAFGAYMDALKLPKATELERTSRREAMNAALLTATETPLRISQECLALLNAANAVSEVVTLHAISDVAAASRIAEATGRNALQNVDENVDLMKDETATSAFVKESATLERAIAAVSQEVQRKIAERRDAAS